MASSSRQQSTQRDWNKEWESKDPRKLNQIPTNPKGLCGCTICGGPRVVTGRVFQKHMMTLYGERPSASPAKRLRQLSPEPSTSAPPHTSPPQLEEPTSSSSLMDFEFDNPPQLELTSLVTLDAVQGEEEDGEVDQDAEAEDRGPETEEGSVGLDAIFSAEEYSSLMQYANDTAFDLPPLNAAPIGLSPAASYAPSPPPEPISPGPFISAPSPPRDLLGRWPFYIPLAMRQPEYSGARLNPHLVSAASHSSELPMLHRLLPVLAHLLIGVFNIARRPVELVLQAASAIIRYAEKVQFNRFKEWYVANHPNAPASVLEDLDLLDPSFEPPAAPATAATALRRIQVESALLVHPQCRNADCHHVYYDIISQDSFSAVPLLCPDCKTPTRNTKGDITVLHFARRSLKAELEVVFRVPGVEKAIERRAERKKQRDAEDERDGPKPWGRIYRQQDDGSAWREERTEDLDRSSLSVTVNIGIDWANLHSRRSAAPESIGPITLLIADLPAQLRSSFSCAMIMGITPGPKAPKAKNLHKLMVPLVMELRDAAINGIWIQTPLFPQGRLVHVHLGVVNCDRPAACELTGAQHYTAHASPCLRCHIVRSQITDLASYPYPNRDSHAHNVGQLDQLVSVPLAVEADRQRHAAEQDAAVRRGERKVRYDAKMQAAAIKEATLFPGHLSALMLVPGYDKFGMTIFDPMHSLLEGAIKMYMHKVLLLGNHGSEADRDLVKNKEAGAEDNDAGGMADEEDANDGEGERGDGDVEDDVASMASGVETEYASETDARAAHTIGTRLIDQLDRGEPLASTPAERAILRKGVSRLGAVATRRKGKRQDLAKAKKPRKKKMTPADMTSLHTIIAATQTPTSVPRLHAEFGTPSAGSPTANHWRVFATVYGPLSIPLLFRTRGKLDGKVTGNSHLSSSELKALMLLFEIVSLGLRSSMSERQIAKLESLISAWQTLAFTLHPTLSASTNIHVLSHLGEDIRRLGQTYGWWTFLIERINYVIKNVNQSGGNQFQAAVIGLRAAVKAREVVSTRMRTLVTTDEDTEEDKAIVAEMLDLFESVSHDGATDLLQQISVRYAEIEKHTLTDFGAYSSSKLSIKPRGKSAVRSLNDSVLRQLQICLAKWNEPTRTLLDGDSVDRELPYLQARATFWEGMVYDGRRLDAAEWDKPIRLDTGTFEATDLVARRNSLFESRRTELIFGCEDKRTVSGVLCAVFEHSMTVSDGIEEEPRLYALIRKLKPFEGHDIYGYRSHPALGVWLWEVDVLEDASVILLTGGTVNTLRPLALTRLPQTIDDRGKPGSAEVWATVPLHHH